MIIFNAYQNKPASPTSKEIKFREEQLDAIKKAKQHFGARKRDGSYVLYDSKKKFLWNAKMRFGKTLCALRLAYEMGAKRTLIVTHRPVVNDGWFKDYKKILDDLESKGNTSIKTNYQYGTRSVKDGTGNYEDLEQFATTPEGHYIFFTSMQYIRLSTLVGGDDNDPLKKDLLNTDWDLVIVDEAHEGTRTQRGQNVIDYLYKNKTKMLHLSGTPFNLYNDFSDTEIYTWDYIQEQEKKNSWDSKHPGEPNPYADLPTMKIFTYNLGDLLGQFVDEDAAFKFTEFFRTKSGNDIPKEERGRFVHEEAVNKFLDKLCDENDKTSNYPFTTENYRSHFNHTLWIVPGVKEAAALEKLLKKHRLFCNFQVINVAGHKPEDEEQENALDRVKDAIGEQPDQTYTITISCARLTTGVTVKPWTAVLYMKGSELTSASTYMQTIFRVQSPDDTIPGRSKKECYVFDFSPMRSLKMVAETAKYSSYARANNNDEGLTQEQRDKNAMKAFIELCPIISLEGGTMDSTNVEEVVNKIYEQLEHSYIDRLVQSGFADNCLWNMEEVLKLDRELVKDLGDRGGDAPVIETKKSLGDITITPLTPEQQAAIDEARRKRREKQQSYREWWNSLDDNQRKAIEAERKAKKAKREEYKKRLSNIRGIALRIPLMMYGGAEVGDTDEELTVENFTRKIKPESWKEFMPPKITKEDFNKIRSCFNETRFNAAGKRYRALAKEADSMHVEDRIKRITDIFNCFHNPDKETVLTPWRVVNMHMSDTLGGYCFWNEKFDGPNQRPVYDEKGNISEYLETTKPRFVDHGEVTSNVFKDIDPKNGHRVKILEINSKTGLYPLYITYTLYRTLMEEVYMKKDETGKALYDDIENISLEEERTTWDDVVANNIYVICNTSMAARITRRTLLGFRDEPKSNIKIERLVDRAIVDRENLIDEIKKVGYWYSNSSKKRMEFKAIVGNPPYQVTSSDGGTRTNAIYHLFIDTAIKLESNYISMISPSRWMTRGAQSISDDWIDKMLVCNHFVYIHDFINATECFSNVDIKGGVNYFLYKSDYVGKCEYVLSQAKETYIIKKYLDELGVGIVIRDPLAAGILQKVKTKELDLAEKNFSTLVSSKAFFGQDETLSSNWDGFSNFKDDENNIKCYVNKRLTDNGYGWMKRSEVFRNKQSIDINKVFIPEASGSGDDPYVLGKPFYGEPGSVCSLTYLCIGYDIEKHNYTKEECFNIISYIKTRFFRYLVSIKKKNQHAPKDVYQFVPTQDFTKTWSDKELYEKYGLEKKEREYIESLINPMD